MTELEMLFCAAALAAFAAVRFRRTRRKPDHGLPHLDRVMRGDADGGQLLDLADALAKSVIDRAKALGKPPLFITASGDLYDDFFPPEEPRAGRAAGQYANALLAGCVRRYRDARNNRNVHILDFPAYTLCAGAGLAVSSFRRLGGCSRNMRDLAEFLAPAPDADDWERYKECYREAGMLLGVPRARIDARLVKRREMFGNGTGDAAKPVP
jgi:hypothetical protein